MEYLQSQLDLVTQQAEAAACKDPFARTCEVHSNHAAKFAAVMGQLQDRVAVGLSLLCADQVAQCLPHIRHYIIAGGVAHHKCCLGLPRPMHPLCSLYCLGRQLAYMPSAD